MHTIYTNGRVGGAVVTAIALLLIFIAYLWVHYAVKIQGQADRAVRKVVGLGESKDMERHYKISSRIGASAMALGGVVFLVYGIVAIASGK